MSSFGVEVSNLVGFPNTIVDYLSDVGVYMSGIFVQPTGLPSIK